MSDAPARRVCGTYNAGADVACDLPVDHGGLHEGEQRPGRRVRWSEFGPDLLYPADPVADVEITDTTGGPDYAVIRGTGTRADGKWLDLTRLKKRSELRDAPDGIDLVPTPDIEIKSGRVAQVWRPRAAARSSD